MYFLLILSCLTLVFIWPELTRKQNQSCKVYVHLLHELFKSTVSEYIRSPTLLLRSDEEEEACEPCQLFAERKDKMSSLLRHHCFGCGIANSRCW